MRAPIEASHPLSLIDRESVMPTRSNRPPTTLADGLRTVSAALGEIDAAHKRLSDREKRLQTLTTKLLGIAQKTVSPAEMLKLQMSMQRENQVFTAVSNVLKTRHDTAKNAIGNIR
jgi:uncharacterized phage infection (PIP) family protein YhgE